MVQGHMVQCFYPYCKQALQIPQRDRGVEAVEAGQAIQTLRGLEYFILVKYTVVVVLLPHTIDFK